VLARNPEKSGSISSWPCPVRSRREEGESAVEWGQRGSEIGRERGSADGRGPIVSERKRGGEECARLGRKRELGCGGTLGRCAGDLGHQARKRERRGFVFLISFSHFFYSKAIFKTILKIALKYV